MDNKNRLDQLSFPEGSYRDRVGVVGHFVVHVFYSLQLDKLKSGPRGPRETNYLKIKVPVDDFSIYLFIYLLCFVVHIIVSWVHMGKKGGRSSGRVVAHNSRPFYVIPFAIG